MSKKELASVDVGEMGHPGSSAWKCICTIYQVRAGRFEAEGKTSTGNNQGYYQCNYSHGPWYGRGDTPEEAVDKLMNVVREEDKADMRRASQECLAQVEDVLNEESEEEELPLSDFAILCREVAMLSADDNLKRFRLSPEFESMMDRLGIELPEIH